MKHATKITLEILAFAIVWALAETALNALLDRAGRYGASR